MFKNRGRDGSNNISGKRIAKFRKKLNLSQRELADAMQLIGLDIGKNAIQTIESGERFVTDLELAYFAYFFGKSTEELLSFNKKYIQDASLAQKVAEDD